MPAGHTLKPRATVTSPREFQLFKLKNRRRKAFMVTGLALAVGVLSLTGCESSESSSPSGDLPSVQTDEAKALYAAMDVDEKHAGGDRKISVGFQNAFSGPGQYYGDVSLRGAKLAVAQIKAAGGPDFELVIKDNKGGDAAAGAQTTRELGQAGIPVMLTSFAASNGSSLAGIEQYKILAFDGTGGTGTAAQGKPYFYGTRSISPSDALPGLAKYLRETYPDAKTAALVIADYGQAITDGAVADYETSFNAEGFDLSVVERVAPGATDFSSSIAKIKADGPDVVLSDQFGADPGYFLKQYRAAGDDTPFYGSDQTSVAAVAAGDAYNGYTFAGEFFGESVAKSPLGALFLKTFKEAYPDADPPDLYAANAYEDVMMLWTLVQRVLADGGDPESSADLEKAFLADPSFLSVSTSTEAPGYFEVDPDTHTVTRRNMGVYEVNGDAIEQLASYDIDARDYQAFK